MQSYLYPLFYAVSAAWGLMELSLGFARRARRKSDKPRDQGTFRLIWVVVSVSCALAGFSAALNLLPFPAPIRPPLAWLGLLLMVVGIVLRAVAIFTLRKFFTSDVAIRADHRLVTTGPYRYVRHPSYAASLLSFLGFGLGLGTLPSLLLATLPVALVFARRVQVEEKVLEEAFGETWRAYAARTSRFIPGIY